MTDQERKLYEDWLHQTPAFAESIVSALDVWMARAALAHRAAPALLKPRTE